MWPFKRNPAKKAARAARKAKNLAAARAKRDELYEELRAKTPTHARTLQAKLADLTARVQNYPVDSPERLNLLLEAQLVQQELLHRKRTGMDAMFMLGKR